MFNQQRILAIAKSIELSSEPRAKRVRKMLALGHRVLEQAENLAPYRNSEAFIRTYRELRSRARNILRGGSIGFKYRPCSAAYPAWSKTKTN